MKSQNKLCSNK